MVLNSSSSCAVMRNKLLRNDLKKNSITAREQTPEHNELEKSDGPSGVCVIRALLIQ